MKKTYLILLSIMAISLQSFSQESSEGFVYDTESRTYLLYIPTTYDASTDTLPLVLALHGLGDTKENFNNFNGFKALAETNKFILATPQAESPMETITVPFLGAIAANTVLQNAWHSGAGGDTYNFNGTPITLQQAYYVSETRDDVGFLSSLIDTISTNFNVNTERIYSTGFSMGGFMTNKLACELNDKIAAIASVSGTIGNEIKNSCNPNEIVPALHIHSEDDQTVLFNNNDWGMDAQENVNFWINNNNCNATAISTDLTNVANDGFTSIKNLYSQGDSASEVEFYNLQGPDHVGSWYVGNKDFVTSEVIWDFFERHEKTRTIAEEPNTISNVDFGIINLFPNPSSGRTTLSITSSESIEMITISNAIGKTILVQNAIKNKNDYTFDLSTYSNGLYFIQLKNKQGEITVKRLIKN